MPDIRCIILLVLCATQSQSGKVIRVTTTGDQSKSVYLNDKGVEVIGQKTLIMDIKACAEAVIQFAQTQQLNGGFFEVYLGSRDNSMSMMRFSGKKKKESVRGSPLDCKAFRTFWFSWEDEGTLRVGSGSIIGVREFLSLEVEERVEIHYIIVYTAMGNEGEWKVLKDGRPEFIHPNRDGSTVIEVREDTPAHAAIYELKAQDPDDDDVTYHVIGQHNDVFGVSGTHLKILKRLDFETKQNYVVTISASDGKHEVRQSMMVMVVDLVDEVPNIGPPIMSTILEELPVGTPIGQLATVVDRDRGAKLKYSIRGRDSHYFNMDPNTGEVRMRKRLDRDKRNGRRVLDQLTLTVDDHIHLQEKKLRIGVIDINDNPPMFGKSIYRVSVKENMLKDTVIANLSCVDIDDGANSVFSLVVASVDIHTSRKKPKKDSKKDTTGGMEEGVGLNKSNVSPSIISGDQPTRRETSGELPRPGVGQSAGERSGRDTNSDNGNDEIGSMVDELFETDSGHRSGRRRSASRPLFDDNKNDGNDWTRRNSDPPSNNQDVVGRNARSTNYHHPRATVYPERDNDRFDRYADSRIQYPSLNSYGATGDSPYSRYHSQTHPSRVNVRPNQDYNVWGDGVRNKYPDRPASPDKDLRKSKSNDRSYTTHYDKDPFDKDSRTSTSSDRGYRSHSEQGAFDGESRQGDHGSQDRDMRRPLSRDRHNNSHRDISSRRITFSDRKGHSDNYNDRDYDDRSRNEMDDAKERGEFRRRRYNFRRRPFWRNRRYNDYDYYDYDNDDTYGGYHRPRKQHRQNYRTQRRKNTGELTGSSWMYGKRNGYRNRPQEVELPDNWGDLLENSEPYLGPRYKEPLKRLEDILKPLEESQNLQEGIQSVPKPTSSSVTNAQHRNTANIITKADQEKIKQRLRSTTQMNVDTTPELTTIKISDTTSAEDFLISPGHTALLGDYDEFSNELGQLENQSNDNSNNLKGILNSTGMNEDSVKERAVKNTTSNSRNSVNEDNDENGGLNPIMNPSVDNFDPFGLDYEDDSTSAPSSISNGFSADDIFGEDGNDSKTNVKNENDTSKIFGNDTEKSDYENLSDDDFDDNDSKDELNDNTDDGIGDDIDSLNDDNEDLGDDDVDMGNDIDDMGDDIDDMGDDIDDMGDDIDDMGDDIDDMGDDIGDDNDDTGDDTGDTDDDWDEFDDDDDDDDLSDNELDDIDDLDDDMDDGTKDLDKDIDNEDDLFGNGTYAEENKNTTDNFESNFTAKSEYDNTDLPNDISTEGNTTNEGGEGNITDAFDNSNKTSHVSQNINTTQTTDDKDLKSVDEKMEEKSSESSNKTNISLEDDSLSLDDSDDFSTEFKDYEKDVSTTESPKDKDDSATTEDNEDEDGDLNEEFASAFSSKTNGTDSTGSNETDSSLSAAVRRKRSSLEEVLNQEFRKYLKKKKQQKQVNLALKAVGKLLSTSRRQRKRRRSKWMKAISKFFRMLDQGTGGSLPMKANSLATIKQKPPNVHNGNTYFKHSLGDRFYGPNNDIPLDFPLFGDMNRRHKSYHSVHQQPSYTRAEDNYLRSLFKHLSLEDSTGQYPVMNRQNGLRIPNKQLSTDGGVSNDRHSHLPMNMNRPLPLFSDFGRTEYLPNRNQDRFLYNIGKFPTNDQINPSVSDMIHETPHKPDHSLKDPISDPQSFPYYDTDRDYVQYQHKYPGYPDLLHIPHRYHAKASAKPWMSSNNNYWLENSDEAGPNIVESSMNHNDVELEQESFESPHYDSGNVGNQETSAEVERIYNELGLKPPETEVDYDNQVPVNSKWNLYDSQSPDRSSAHRPKVDYSLNNRVSNPPQFHQPDVDLGLDEHALSKQDRYNRFLNGELDYDSKEPNLSNFLSVDTNQDIDIPDAEDQQEENSMENTGTDEDTVDMQGYVSQPLSSLLKLHIETNSESDKMPMNDYVLVPKSAVKHRLDDEIEASDQVKRNHQIKNEIHNVGQNKRDKEYIPLKRSEKSGKRLYSTIHAATDNNKFTEQLVSLIKEDRMLDKSPKSHFPPLSSYKLDSSHISTSKKRDPRFFYKYRPIKITKESTARKLASPNLRDAAHNTDVKSDRSFKSSLRKVLEAAINGDGSDITDQNDDQSPPDDGSYPKTPSDPRKLYSTGQRYTQTGKGFQDNYKMNTKFLNKGININNFPSGKKIRNGYESHSDKRKDEVFYPIGMSKPHKYGDNKNVDTSSSSRLRNLPKRDTTRMNKPMFEAKGLSIVANSKSVDYDSMGDGDHTFTLTVLAIDKPEYGSPLTGTTMVLVEVIPVNEFTPEWVSPAVNGTGWFPSVLVPENVSVGTHIITLSATDEDGGEDGRVTYSLTQVTAANGKDGQEFFTIEPETGILKTAAMLDRDPQTGGVTHLDLVITASDNGDPTLSTQATMRVSLADINDNPPVFGKLLYEAILPTSWTKLSAWKMQLDVKDHDRKANFKFKIVKGDAQKFLLDENTGTLSLSGTPDRTLPYKVFTVMASDGGTPQLNSTTQVIIHTQKYSFEQVKAAIDAKTKNEGPWVFKMLSGVFGFVLLFIIIIYVCKKYGMFSSVVGPNGERLDDDISVHDGNRSRVINIAPPPDVTNRADNSGIEHIEVPSRKVQQHGGVTSLQSVEEGQESHPPETTITSMRKGHRY